MKNYKELASSKLNWQAVAVEETQSEIKQIIKRGILSAKNYANIMAEIGEEITGLMEQLENEPLKAKVAETLTKFANRVYMAYLQAMVGLTYLGAKITTKPSMKSPPVINVIKNSLEIANRSAPSNVDLKLAVKQSKERLRNIALMEPKEDYTDRSTLRNIAEIEIRAEKREKNVAEILAKGTRLVWISTHGNCSERCEPYQGRLYSLDGTSGKENGISYEPLENATNKYQTTKSGKTYKNGIISGFNCRHFLIPYEQGNKPLNVSAKEIGRQRAIEKKQRQLERNVRNYKELSLTFKGIDNTLSENYKILAKKWNAEYIKFSKENEVPFYPSRTDIF